MKPPNHGCRIRVTAGQGLADEWTGRPLYLPATRHHPYVERTGLGLLVDDGECYGQALCILTGDRIEVIRCAA